LGFPLRREIVGKVGGMGSLLEEKRLLGLIWNYRRKGKGGKVALEKRISVEKSNRIGVFHFRSG
jgi:hypothetical protein